MQKQISKDEQIIQEKKDDILKLELERKRQLSISEKIKKQHADSIQKYNQDLEKYKVTVKTLEDSLTLSKKSHETLQQEMNLLHIHDSRKIITSLKKELTSQKNLVQMCNDEKFQLETDLENALEVSQKIKREGKKEMKRNSQKYQKQIEKLTKQVQQFDESRISMDVRIQDLTAQLKRTQEEFELVEKQNKEYEKGHDLQDIMESQNQLRQSLKKKDFDVQSLNLKLGKEMDGNKLLKCTIHAIMEKLNVDNLNKVLGDDFDGIKQQTIILGENVLKTQNQELMNQIDSLESERLRLLRQLRDKAGSGYLGFRLQAAFGGLSEEHVGYIMEFIENLRKHGTKILPLNDKSQILQKEIIELKAEIQVNQITLRKLERELAASVPSTNSATEQHVATIDAQLISNIQISLSQLQMENDTLKEKIKDLSSIAEQQTKEDTITSTASVVEKGVSATIPQVDKSTHTIEDPSFHTDHDNLVDINILLTEYIQRLAMKEKELEKSGLEKKYMEEKLQENQNETSSILKKYNEVCQESNDLSEQLKEVNQELQLMKQREENEQRKDAKDSTAQQEKFFCIIQNLEKKLEDVEKELRNTNSKHDGTTTGDRDGNSLQILIKEKDVLIQQLQSQITEFTTARHTRHNYETKYTDTKPEETKDKSIECSLVTTNQLTTLPSSPSHKASTLVSSLTEKLMETEIVLSQKVSIIKELESRLSDSYIDKHDLELTSKENQEEMNRMKMDMCTLIIQLQDAESRLVEFANTAKENRPSTSNTSNYEPFQLLEQKHLSLKNERKLKAEILKMKKTVQGKNTLVRELQTERKQSEEIMIHMRNQINTLKTEIMTLKQNLVLIKQKKDKVVSKSKEREDRATSISKKLEKDVERFKDLASKAIKSKEIAESKVMKLLKLKKQDSAINHNTSGNNNQQVLQPANNNHTIQNLEDSIIDLKKENQLMAMKIKSFEEEKQHKDDDEEEDKIIRSDKQKNDEEETQIVLELKREVSLTPILIQYYYVRFMSFSYRAFSRLCLILSCSGEIN